MNKYPVWFDCDVGCDDAVALMAAHALPEIQLLGISTVCGNTTQDNVYHNAHRMNVLMGSDYPIHRGAEKPLMRELHVAAAFHGENGLGNVELPLPQPLPVQELAAWDAIYAAAKAHPGELRLIAVGPMTNVAIALAKYPDLSKLLHTILIMGGAAVGGNTTPAAEFNIYDDPEAAELVFSCGVPIVMCGLDVTLKAVLTPKDMEELSASGKACGKFVRDCLQCAWKTLQGFGFPGVAMHDSCPVLYLAHPELFRGEEAGVHVETKGTISLGKTVTDLYSDKQFPEKNAIVVLDLDRDRFIDILKSCILSIG